MSKDFDFSAEVGVGGKPENTQGISLADAARALVRYEQDSLGGNTENKPVEPIGPNTGYNF